MKIALFRCFSQNCEKHLLASSFPSVCPHGTNQFPLDGLRLNYMFDYLPKISRENSSIIGIGQE